MRKHHFYKQHDRSDCGATCLRMVCRYYGKHFSAATMQRLTACGREDALPYPLWMIKQ